MWRNTGDYTPFSVSPAVSAIVFDETHAYAPPARRFYTSGHVSAEVDNYENRTHTAAVPLIPPVVLGSLARVLGGLERAFIAADCIFPALVFLLLFYLAHDAAPHWRFLIAWTTLIFSFGILNFFWTGGDALIAPLEITRTPQPELSFLVYLGAVALFARGLENAGARQKLWLVLAGLASAALVYSYYFYAVAWAATLICAILFASVLRNRTLLYAAFLLLAIMAALAIPYAVTVLRNEGQNDLLGRVGVFTHEPRIGPLLLACLAAIVIWRIKGLLTNPALLILSLSVVGSLAGMNVHIFTGYETQSWHFWKRLGLPAAFFLISVLVARTMADRLPHARLWAQLVLVLVLLSTCARLCVVGARTAPYQRASNPQIELLKWVDRQLPRNRVIGTVDPELILLIPAMTTDYNYAPSGIRSLTATDEITGRYYEMACLLGLTPADLENSAAAPNHLSHSTEVLHTLGLSSIGDPAVFRSFLTGYQSVLTHCSRPSFRLDYAIASSTAEMASIERHFSGAREIYRRARYRLLDLTSRPNGKSY